jgi:hypothetical protein
LPPASALAGGLPAEARYDLLESSSRLCSLIERDLRANALRVYHDGKPLHTFPDHAFADRHLKISHFAGLT